MVSIVATSDLLHLGRMEAKKRTWRHAKTKTLHHNTKKKQLIKKTIHQNNEIKKKDLNCLRNDLCNVKHREAVEQTTRSRQLNIKEVISWNEHHRMMFRYLYNS